MKIFVTHSSDTFANVGIFSGGFNFKDELYEPLKNSDLNIKHEIILPQKNGYELITKEIINECDLIVAEVSFPSTGQGIELGWANVFKIPIVCIYKDDCKYSNSLTKITNNFISYKDENEMILKLSDYIKNIGI